MRFELSKTPDIVASSQEVTWGMAPTGHPQDVRDFDTVGLLAKQHAICKIYTVSSTRPFDAKGATGISPFSFLCARSTSSCPSEQWQCYTPSQHHHTSTRHTGLRIGLRISLMRISLSVSFQSTACRDEQRQAQQGW